MKLLTFLLLLLCFQVCAQCPIKGDSHTTRLQHLDSLKNRTQSGKNIVKMDISQFITSDSNFSENTYVSLTGYVVGVKYGGKESCNCHTDNRLDWDYHIDIASTPNESDDKKMMIVEVTRFSRDTLTLKYCKSLIGKKVIVEGWIFNDEEHKQNSVTTNPNGTYLWRATPYELHPVFSISEF